MFVFHLDESTKSPEVKGAVVRNAHKGNFPALEGMAANRLSMNPGTLNVPHWHPNSHEVVYIISGKALFGIRGRGQELSVFEANPGEFVFIEKSYMHYFKSIGSDTLEVGVWLTSVTPNIITLVDTFRGTPDPELAQAFGVEQELVVGFSTATTRQLSGHNNYEQAQVDTESPFKFNLKDNNDPEVLRFNERGTGQVRIIDPEVCPVLKNLTFAHITLKPGAMRQIHWHQYANELNLVVQGQAEFGIMTPQSTSFVATATQDFLMMAPKGYPHYVKNTGEDDLEFLLCFDHATIDSIDVRGCFEVMLNSIKTQTLKVPRSRFDQFKTDHVSLLPPVSAED